MKSEILCHHYYVVWGVYEYCALYVEPTAELEAAGLFAPRQGILIGHYYSREQIGESVGISCGNCMA